MNELEIYNVLIDIVSDSLEDDNLKEKVNMDTNIFTDLEMTSIAMLYIAMGIEDKFSIKLNNEDVSKYQTVRDWVNYIASKLR